MAWKETQPLPPFGAVDIWLVSLLELTSDARAFHEQRLTADELARAQRYVAPHARDQFVVARALLRTQLSRYTNTPISDWIFEANRFGRPNIAEPIHHRHMRFNLSHTNGLVACAIASECEIGVDIENVTRELDVFGLSKSFFAPPETEALARLAPDLARSRFFSYWTLKESYIKARGMGLSLPLDAFWFELGQKPRLYCDARCQDSPARWQFFLERPAPEHQLALAVESAPNAIIEVRYFWLTPYFTPRAVPDGIGGCVQARVDAK